MVKTKSFQPPKMKIYLKDYSRANIKTFINKDSEYWNISNKNNKTDIFGKYGLWTEKNSKKDMDIIEEGIYIKGKKHGLWKYWINNYTEELFYIVSYKKGKLHGLCREYTFMKNKIDWGLFPKEKDFILTKDSIYFHNKEVSSKEYDEKGLILSESSIDSIEFEYIPPETEEIIINKELLRFLFRIALSTKYEKYERYYTNRKLLIFRLAINLMYFFIYALALLCIRFYYELHSGEINSFISF